MLSDSGSLSLHVSWLCLPAEGMGWPDGRPDPESLPSRSWLEFSCASVFLCIHVGSESGFGELSSRSCIKPSDPSPVCTGAWMHAHLASLCPYSLALLTCLSLSLLNPVPFREAPAYSNRRRRPPNTLAAPRVLLRSNSDNNLHAGAPEWAVCSAATSHRSLSPQLLQQTPNKPDGATKSLGSYVPGPRSRSPSLNRLGGTGEDGKRPQPHWHVG